MCTAAYVEKHTLNFDYKVFTLSKASSLLHSMKHVSRGRGKSDDVLSLSFYQLKLLPTHVHHSVTDCHVMQHIMCFLQCESEFGRDLPNVTQTEQRSSVSIH